jgi:predicted nucleotidyltransferase
MTSAEPHPNGLTAVADQVARRFASLSQVEAVALAGSRTSEFPDGDSDVDLYVYVTEDIPLDVRAEIAAGASHAEIGNATWEPGDEWIDVETGTRIDVMYRHVRWIEEQLDRMLVHHMALVGYSTCFWYNVLRSQALFDRAGWFAALQRRALQPYPAELKRAIIDKNYPLLRHNQSSYLHQIELAVKRNDSVSVNHRVAALLASYFDVLFAVNEQPHPGEKRLLQHAARCERRPNEMEAQVVEVFEAVGRHDADVVSRIRLLLDRLDELLAKAGRGAS